MTRQQQIEIMTAELAKSEQLCLKDCRRWIERGFAAVDAEEAAVEKLLGCLRDEVMG